MTVSILVEIDKLAVLEALVILVAELVADGLGDENLLADDEFVLVNDQVLFLLIHLELDAAGHGSIVCVDERKIVALA